jgi:dephospho-CoA kinase
MNIALTGALRSGKDSVAAYLTQKYGYTRFAFGDELKRDFHRRYPEIPRTPKPRVGYQSHGQLMRVLIDEDVWVTRCFEEITYGHAGAESVVISDLRQPNEYAECKRLGYVIIRVKAQSALRIQRAVESADTFDLRDLTHDTESHTDGFAVDYEVVNDGSLAELYAQIDVIMDVIERRP